ncbi:guanine deaminase [Lentilactobacillus kosonis]|uniref:Guanine deaminase n=1 Tax=Lentilactobacillus kosonis TaxID=2810561 RepID=A0A401FNP5_9LACO|nr:guanine deaminase [Lentilactobacillus kosonis]GAY74002.1 guanine deaminase [Lentilactobacillus kosonis]
MYLQVIEGNYFTSADRESIYAGEDALICIDQGGKIARIVKKEASDFSEVRQAALIQSKLHQLSNDERLLPGFIDLHVHAPQWPQAGLALDKPLNDWLNTYTFPLEAKYKDVEFATPVYADLMQNLLANGTTTAMIFGTVYNDSNLELAKQAVSSGLRAFIGKVAMDNPDETPEYYRDFSAEQALEDTEIFIEKILAMQANSETTIFPVITPRFVPSCTDELLAGLGNLARRYDLPVQSHCSESDWEDQYVLDRFHKRDAEVLDYFGLLTDKSVMAHGTQLSNSDLDLFKNRQTAVAHCPISNAYFGNAVFPTNVALANGNKVGMGSDISGGYSPSIYKNMQQSVMASQMLTDGVDRRQAENVRGAGNSRISMKTAFYLATRGGAEALHIPTGAIEVGYQADFQVVKLHSDYLTNDRDDEFEQLMYQTERADICQVIVGGKQVYQR